MLITNKKIGFVAPRYGNEVLGGAERHLRAWAEQLHARGYAVEAFATCVLNIHEWRDHYPPGPDVVNGVPVQRFPLDPVDLGLLQRVTEKAMRGEQLTYSEQLAFIGQQVNSQPLYQHLHEHQDEFACFIFSPYVFGTTYHGINTVPDKALILPCLHDETFAYFTIYREMLEQVRGILFNTEATRQFARQVMGVVNPASTLVGYGFDPDAPAGDGARFRAAHNLAGDLLFYAGRMEDGKNVPLLVNYFVRYKEEHPKSTLRLVLGGRGNYIPPERPDIATPGFIAEAELPDAFAAATIFCLPSIHESFSIVIMEAWQQCRPVLVHGDCAVTREHVERSGGGWAFRSYNEFRDALDVALRNPAERDQRGRAGRDYVRREYTWDAVIERLLDGIERFTQPRSLRNELGQRGIRHALDYTSERFTDQLDQIVSRVEVDMMQGLTHTQIKELQAAAHVAMPEYQVRSGAPLIGRLIAWLRRNLTSHLREPYLDPIVERQEQYNKMLLDSLLPALERSVRERQRLERQVSLLQQQVQQMQQMQENPSDQVRLTALQTPILEQPRLPE